jgi:ABC-type xylose transport system substrate-binding protein
MDKRDLKEYGIAHRACQTISDIIEKLENMDTVLEHDSDKMEEFIQYLCNIRDNEVNFYIDFENDHCK